MEQFTRGSDGAEAGLALIQGVRLDGAPDRRGDGAWAAPLPLETITFPAVRVRGYGPDECIGCSECLPDALDWDGPLE